MARSVSQRTIMACGLPTQANSADRRPSVDGLRPAAEGLTGTTHNNIRHLAVFGARLDIRVRRIDELT
jgi:hypothetical protein